MFLDSPQVLVAIISAIFGLATPVTVLIIRNLLVTRAKNAPKKDRIEQAFEIYEESYKQIKAERDRLIAINQKQQDYIAGILSTVQQSQEVVSDDLIRQLNELKGLYNKANVMNKQKTKDLT